MIPADFIQAKKRISPYLTPTPMLKSDILQKTLGYNGSIYFKLECEQPTGSFKVRGAFNALLQLDPSVEKVVTFSSGNFAQAVAYGASIVKKRAAIVIPKNAPHIKIEGTKKFGAEIIFCDVRHEDGDAIVKELVEKKGYCALHPFNSYHTMAGQGTASLEIIGTNPHLQHFFSPVGGGGLLSGCAAALKAYNREIIIYSVEPLGAHDFYDSFQAKEHIAFEKTNTIADGLRSVSVGKLNYPILMSTVDQAVAVSEDTIIEAMYLLWKYHKMIIEPSGAVALAGFLSMHHNLQGEVVILVTGKNVDLEAFNGWVGAHA